MADCYHMWVFEKGFELPFGIHPKDKKTTPVNRGSTRTRCILSDGSEVSMRDMLERTGSLGAVQGAYVDGMAAFLKNNMLKG